MTAPVSSDVEETAHLPRALVSRLAQWCPPNSLVIDLGCGKGELLESLRRTVPGLRGVGVDTDVDSLRLAAKTTVGVAFVVGDINGFSTAPRSVSLVVSLDAFHLIDNPWRRARELATCLAAHGVLAVIWREDAWEEITRPRVVEILGANGIDIEDWGFWRCPHLVEVFRGERWAVSEHRFESPRRTVTLDAAVDYVMSIERVRYLPSSTLVAIKRQLVDGLRPYFPEEGLQSTLAFTLLAAAKKRARSE